jgi:hypothetical protein
MNFFLLFILAFYKISSLAQVSEQLKCDENIHATKTNLHMRFLDELDNQSKLRNSASTQAAEAWRNFQNDPFLKKCGAPLGSRGVELVLKELYLKERDNKSPIEKELIPLILANFINDGKPFMSAADLIQNPATDSDTLLSTINQQSSFDADIISQQHLRQIRNSLHHDGVEQVIPDHVCELIDKYISKQTDRLNALTSFSFNQNWMDRCGGLLLLEQLDSVGSTINPPDICEIKGAILSPLTAANIKLSLNQSLSLLEQKLISKINNVVMKLNQFPSPKCPGFIGDLDTNLQNMLKKLLPFIPQESSRPNSSQLQLNPLIKTGVCDPKKIHKWIIKEIETSYKTTSFKKRRVKGKVLTEVIPGPSRRAFGGGQIDNCHFISRITPFIKTKTDPKSKQKIIQNWAHVRIEIFQPKTYLIDFKVLDSEIIFGIYDQFINSGLVKKNIKNQSQDESKIIPINFVRPSASRK